MPLSQLLTFLFDILE